MGKALGLIRSKRAVVGVITALALLLVVLVSGETDRAHAGQWWSANSLHWFVIVDISNLSFYSGIVESSASTYGDNNGSVLSMTAHRNTANVVNGRCGLRGGYPFCWGAINNPVILYYHDTNSHTLRSDWEDTTWNCLFRRDDHGYCYENETVLGWSTFPVTADAWRDVPLKPGRKGTDRYTYTYPCCGSYMTPHTMEYTVR